MSLSMEDLDSEGDHSFRRHALEHVFDAFSRLILQPSFEIGLKLSLRAIGEHIDGHVHIHDIKLPPHLADELTARRDRRTPRNG